MTAEHEWPVPWEAVEGSRTGVSAWTEFVLARAALGGIGRLPRGLQRSILAGIARLARTIDPRHARAARDFVAQALPGLMEAERAEIVRAAWVHFLELTVRNAVFHRHVQPETLLSHYDVEMCDDAHRVLASGQGSILAACHVGDWEAGGLVMPALGFRPFYGVARPPRNRPLSRFVQQQRERYDMRILARNGAVAAIPRITAAGGCVGLLMDQRARKKPIVAPFFGRPAHCERSVAVLVKRLRVPVLVGCCYVGDEPFRYEAKLHKVIWPEELSDLSPLELTTRLNSELEAMILARPEQYFWLHDRYANAPLQMPTATTSQVGR